MGLFDFIKRGQKQEQRSSAAPDSVSGDFQVAPGVRAEYHQSFISELRVGINDLKQLKDGLIFRRVNQAIDRVCEGINGVARRCEVDPAAVGDAREVPLDIQFTSELIQTLKRLHPIPGPNSIEQASRVVDALDVLARKHKGIEQRTKIGIEADAEALRRMIGFELTGQGSAHEQIVKIFGGETHGTTS